MPDTKELSPTVLRDLDSAQLADDIADRDEAAERANRDAGRKGGKNTPAVLTEEEAQAKAWLLPLEDFTFTSPYGARLGKLHAGIDLAADEGTPYKAVHAGLVTKAGYEGGYGYMITIKHDDGSELIYAHSRRLMVKTGDKVKAGQVIGQVGNTGYSYGTHLHLEMHVNGKPADPIPALRKRGVDIKMKFDSLYGVAS